MKNDDIETLRILFGATIGELCNQERWNDAKEMEGIKGRLIQALESQSEDCISRQAAIVQLSHNKTGDDDCDVIVQKDIETIKALPSVNPQPKMGHWILHEIEDTLRWYECDQCGGSAVKEYNYCHDCGIKMQLDGKERKNDI